MKFSGIDGAVFGVEDLAAATRFFDDFGLARDAGEDGAVSRFTTRDGTQVALRHRLDPSLPAAMQEGPTLREVIWGVRDEASLRELAQCLPGSAADREGRLQAVDPNGLSHAFRITQRRPVMADPQDVNGPGVARRIDRRSPVYAESRPISLGHVVMFVDNLQTTVDFFVKKLGFVVSDSYPGHAAFLRACTPGSHHDLFVLARPGRPGLNHVAFTVSNIHEVFGAGLAMSRKGWETDIGPGRHPISSAYFWYLKSPLGGAVEYYADDDWCTEAWQPREFERRPELFAEWAIAGGIDGTTRRQARAPEPR